ENREDAGGWCRPGRGAQVGSRPAGGGVREHSPRQAGSNLLPRRREAQALPAQESTHRDRARSVKRSRASRDRRGRGQGEAPKVSEACPMQDLPRRPHETAHQ
ncbi:hypothetical protein ABG768_020812, partial [Culter alburnus]